MVKRFKMKNLIFLAGIRGIGKIFLLNQVHLPKSIIHLTATAVSGWNSISKDQKDKKGLSI